LGGARRPRKKKRREKSRPKRERKKKDPRPRKAVLSPPCLGELITDYVEGEGGGGRSQWLGKKDPPKQNKWRGAQFPWNERELFRPKEKRGGDCQKKKGSPRLRKKKNVNLSLSTSRERTYARLPKQKKKGGEERSANRRRTRSADTKGTVYFCLKQGTYSIRGQRRKREKKGSLKTETGKRKHIDFQERSGGKTSRHTRKRKRGGGKEKQGGVPVSK